MEDEDIKIVEERIDYFKNNPEGCNWKLSFEDEEDIQAIENILNRLKIAERMNDVLAEEVRRNVIHYYNGKIDCVIGEEILCYKAKGKDCTECIKEWARKKVEDEKDI